VKHPWTINIHLKKKEGKDGGSGHSKGIMSVNMVDVFVSIYEDRKMKPVEIVLRGEELMERVNLNML
jgi:hypothetical protein